MSHSDVDHTSKILEEMFGRKAAEMTRRGENLITAGRPSEQPLMQRHERGFLIRHMPDDDMGCLRISIGESPDIEGSAYLVFRGNREQVLTLLTRALGILEGMGGEA